MLEAASPGGGTADVLGAVSAGMDLACLGQQMTLLAEGDSLFAAFGDIPDARLLTPQSGEEWEIQTFNVTMKIPNRFTTVDQVGDWIKDCAYLNRETIGIFLTESGHEAVLEYISYFLANLHAKLSLVDNLKVFFAVTGVVELESSSAESQMRIKNLLAQFAKGFSEHNVLHIESPSLISDISLLLLQMSEAMRSGQSAPTLQHFFIDIRALNANQNVLSSRIISDIYNDFTSIGPFKRIKGRKAPDYFLMNPLRSEKVTVYFGFEDNEPKEVWIMVTKTVIYLFVGEEKEPFGCIPLYFVRASLGRLLPWTVELHSCRGSGVPFIRFNSEEYYQKVCLSDILCVPFVSVRVSDQTTDILYLWLDLIESCCWECRQDV